MKRKITEPTAFARTADNLIAERKLLRGDLEELKKELIRQPESGTIIPGTGGVRKIRIKAANKGKRGGFRIYPFHCNLTQTG